MTRRVWAATLLALVVTGCTAHATAGPSTDLTSRPSVACTPPAGGRCAADVAWHGPIQRSSDDRRLHARVRCGGTLHANETPTTVTLTLHVGAMGPGSMSCAVPDIGVRLSEPLGNRTVIDAVSSREIRVVPDRPMIR